LDEYLQTETSCPKKTLLSLTRQNTLESKLQSDHSPVDRAQSEDQFVLENLIPDEREEKKGRFSFKQPNEENGQRN